MFKLLLTAVFLFIFAGLAIAQTSDSTVKAAPDTVIKRDTVKRSSFAPKIKKDQEYHPDSTHSPKLAVRRSLFVPGWGQFYNRGLWWLKVPAIYVGLGFLGNAIVTNQKNYKVFLALAKIANTGGIPQKGDPLYASYVQYKAQYNLYVVSYGATFDDLSSAASGYQRNFQISILGVIAVWGIQAVEAYIDAKFINAYTVDNNLSIRVSPTLMQPLYASNINNAFIPGLKITFTL